MSQIIPYLALVSYLHSEARVLSPPQRIPPAVRAAGLLTLIHVTNNKPLGAFIYYDNVPRARLPQMSLLRRI
jgi:hypothetical protein